jgi:glutamate/tyrosine decarboxylase-like PLP-dependent enzyme
MTGLPQQPSRLFVALRPLAVIIPLELANGMKSQAPTDDNDLTLFRDALEMMRGGFKDLPDFLPPRASPELQLVLLETARKLRDNFPYHHPLYAGQMLKPPHPIARMAYALAMWLNPNNHALDGGRATSAMEKEAVAQIASLFGWTDHLGHLCSGGTMANLEALWVAGQVHPGKTIVASSQAHYTHKRLSAVLGLPFESTPCDRHGRMSTAALGQLLSRAEGRVGTVVATIGTTATGSVDPLPELLQLRDRYGFRLHADAAYGGYFKLDQNLAPDTKAAFNRLGEADSIVIDPHKHGLQPYGCGCVLFKDPSVGRFYKHDSPYTYFTSAELHLGEISLECSRPGAAAAALWATQKLLPLAHGGEFATLLSKSRRAAIKFFDTLRADQRFVTAFSPELDIVVWAPRARRVSETSALSRQVFAEAAALGLHLALATLPANFFDFDAAGVECDATEVTCLRSVLMKPEHEDWVDKIFHLLDLATATVISRSQTKETR